MLVREQHGTQPIILHFSPCLNLAQSGGAKYIQNFCGFTGASKAHKLSTTTAKSSHLKSLANYGLGLILSVGMTEWQQLRSWQLRICKMARASK